MIPHAPPLQGEDGGGEGGAEEAEKAAAMPQTVSIPSLLPAPRPAGGAILLLEMEAPNWRGGPSRPSERPPDGVMTVERKMRGRCAASWVHAPGRAPAPDSCRGPSPSAGAVEKDDGQPAYRQQKDEAGVGLAQLGDKVDAVVKGDAHDPH